MAVSKEGIKAHYPLPAYNYRVTILSGGPVGLPAGPTLGKLTGDAVVISCSEVSGLNMEIETVTYKHGLSFIAGSHIMPAQKKAVTLTIKKGVTSQSQYLRDWIRLVYPVIVPNAGQVFRKRDIAIDLCDETGSPIVRWLVLKALPTKLEAPTFDANTNEVAFESLQLTASQLSVQHI